MRKSLIIIIVIAIMIGILPFQSSKADFEQDTDDTFSVVWLSDTQDMAYSRYGGAMAKMGKWISDHRISLDIRYVFQTGDAVDNGAAPKQWKEFDTMYDQFKDDIPYIGAAGNHEVKKNGYLEFLQRPEVLAIPESNRFEGGKSAYITFEVNSCKFIVVAIGFGVEKESAEWVSHVLSEHKSYTAILILHDNLGQAQKFGITGKWVFENITSKNPNVRLVLSGHVKGTNRRTDAIDDNGDGNPDRVVTQMTYDYQGYREDCGQLRVLQFNTKTHSIIVTTFSPVTNRYYKDYWFGNTTTFTLLNAF